MKVTAAHTAYSADRRRLVRTRVTHAALVALAPICLAASVNVLVIPDRLAERLAAFGTEAALCLAAVKACSDRRLERQAVPVAVMFVIGIATALLWSISLSPRDLDVLVCPIASTMVASTLLFPWGVRAQTVVSLSVAAGYLGLVPWSTLDTTRIVNVSLSLGLGIGTSIVGAFVLDRQRWATFREREQVATLAEQRAMLLEAGRELSSTLELPELVTRVTRLGHRLVGSDSASLTLLDDHRGVFRAVAMSSDQPGRNHELLGVEFRREEAGAFLDEIARRRTWQLPDGTPFDAVQATVAERVGFGRTLYVAIRRDGHLIGFLTFNQYAAEPQFSEPRVLLAEGVAHQAAIALANARLVNDLQTAGRVKSEFVSTMSHELRTPLHVIMGYTEMLDDLPAEEHPRAVEKIRAASRELLELIEATLNLNRLEIGGDAPRVEPVAVQELWDELASEFDALPRPAGLALCWEPAGDLVLATDRRKLRTVVKNLVGNALKFTSAGEVAVRAAVDGAQCRITVRDTGVGIRVDQVPLIFEMFRQADSSDTRSYGGVGLGLYIVRRLIEQLGGEVSVESEPGRGSTFTVSLPLEPPAEGALRAIA
jgi:signal transduction histidine kinase